MVSISQPSLSGGEISPNLYSRTDLARWPVSLKLMRNFISLPYGGAKNRSGTRFIAEVKDSSSFTRLIPFKRSTTESYVLETGNLYMRPFKNGARLPVSDIVTPYTTTELQDLNLAQSVDVLTITHPLHQNRNITRSSDVSWATAAVPMMTGPWLELNIDDTLTMCVDKVVGTAKLLASTAIFDAATHEGRLVWIEQRSWGIPWEPGKAITAGWVRRSDGKYYQALNTATSGSIRPAHGIESAYDGDGGVNWQYLHSGFGIASIDHVVSPTEANVTILSRMPEELSGSSTGTGFGAAVSLAGATYHADGSGWLVIHKVAHGIPLTSTGPGRVTLNNGYLSGMKLTAITVDDITTNITGTTFGYMGGSLQFIEPPTGGVTFSDRWKFSAWGATQGWPSCVFYFQGRRGYAGTPAQPNVTWLSRSNALNDFTPSTPLIDTDPLTFPIVSSQLDAVRGFLPMNKLVILTAGGNWTLGTGRDDVATPANTMPAPQGYRGADTLAPLGVGETALFVQDGGSVVRDLDYDLTRDKYTGNDLTVFADHLLEGKKITGWCLQQNPFTIVWMVRNDGVLLGLTYMKEQQVAGWHHHDTAGGLVESICCVRESDEDAVYVIVQRIINGATKRYIERVNTRLITDIRYAVFTDSALLYDGSEKTSMIVDGDDYHTATMTITRTPDTTTVTAVNDTFGTGDGVTPSFTIPATYPTITALNRVDWQGNRLLYATQRTNIAVQSRTWTTTWTYGAMSASAVVGFDGNAGTAWRLLPDTTNTYHRNNLTVVFGAGTNCISILAKADGYSKIGLRTLAGTCYAVFDLSNGTVVSSGSGGTGFIEAVPGGWLCSMVCAPGAGSTTLQIIVMQPAYTTGVPTSGWIADGTSGIVASDLQVEVGSIPTSRIVTAAAAASVTDYTLIDDGNGHTTVSMAQVPVYGALMKWTGTGTSQSIVAATAWSETDQLTVTCSVPFFQGDNDLGDGIFYEDLGDGKFYRLLIEQYVSPTTVKARPNQTIPVLLRETARLDWQMARDTFTLSHLKGCEVSVLADGNSKGRYTVDAVTGKIKLDRPAVRMVAGLPIEADLQTLSVQAGQETLSNKRKAIISVSVSVLESRSIKAGRTFADLRASKERRSENYDTPTRLQDGIITIPIPTPWGTDGSVCIRQDEPLPLTITSITPEVEIGSL